MKWTKYSYSEARQLRQLNSFPWRPLLSQVDGPTVYTAGAWLLVESWGPGYRNPPYALFKRERARWYWFGLFSLDYGKRKAQALDNRPCSELQAAQIAFQYTGR